MMAILEVEHLNKSFERTRVLEDISFSLEKGQYSPSLMLAYRIALVFHTTVEELCCLEENKELEDRMYENL